MGFFQHYRSNSVGKKIGATMGMVEDIRLFIINGSSSPIVKALINIDIDKPLTKGVNIGNKDDEAY